MKRQRHPESDEPWAKVCAFLQCAKTANSLVTRCLIVRGEHATGKTSLCHVIAAKASSDWHVVVIRHVRDVQQLVQVHSSLTRFFGLSPEPPRTLVLFDVAPTTIGADRRLIQACRQLRLRLEKQLARPQQSRQQTALVLFELDGTETDYKSIGDIRRALGGRQLANARMLTLVASESRIKKRKTLENVAPNAVRLVRRALEAPEQRMLHWHDMVRETDRAATCLPQIVEIVHANYATRAKDLESALETTQWLSDLDMLSQRHYQAIYLAQSLGEWKRDLRASSPLKLHALRRPRKPTFSPLTTLPINQEFV